jgi:putative endonuclease
MTQPKQRLGRTGENYAAAQLEARGHRIIERNWRHELGEIDIITSHQDEIVFVEVRTRRGHLQRAIEAALASVDERKRERLVTLAQTYLAENDLSTAAWRIDVVAVAVRLGQASLEVIEDAVSW